jgi:hypothetical protein
MAVPEPARVSLDSLLDAMSADMLAALHQGLVALPCFRSVQTSKPAWL